MESANEDNLGSWDSKPVDEKLMNVHKLAQNSLVDLVRQKNQTFTDEQLDLMLPGESEGWAIVEAPEDYVRCPPDLEKQLELVRVHEMANAQAEIVSPDNIELGLKDEMLPRLTSNDLLLFEELFAHKTTEGLSFDEVNHLKVLKLIIQLKNGNNKLRKKATHYILANIKTLTIDRVLEETIKCMSSGLLLPDERHALLKFLRVILPIEPSITTLFLRRFLLVIRGMFNEMETIIQSEAEQLVVLITRISTVDNVISAMAPDFSTTDRFTRTATAALITHAAIDIPNTLFRLIDSLAGTTERMHKLQAVAILKCVTKAQIDIRGWIHLISQVFVVLLKEHAALDKPQNEFVVNALIDTLRAAKLGPSFKRSVDPLLSVLFEMAKDNNSCILPASLLNSAVSDDSRSSMARTTMLLTTIQPRLRYPDRRLISGVCESIRVLLHPNLDNGFVNAIYNDFCQGVVQTKILKLSVIRQEVLSTFLEFERILIPKQLLHKLYFYLRNQNESIRIFILEIFSQLRIIDFAQIKTSWKILSSLIICLKIPLEVGDENDQRYSMYAARRLIKLIPNLIKKVKHFLGDFIVDIFKTVKAYLQSDFEGFRCIASALIGSLAPFLSVNVCQSFSIILYETLRQEQSALALSGHLEAISTLCDAFTPLKLKPSVSEFIPRLTPIFQNSDAAVSYNLVVLVGKIAKYAKGQAYEKEWKRILFRLVELFRSFDYKIRRATVSAVDSIARVLPVSGIVPPLVKNLKVSERSSRVSTTVVLGLLGLITPGAAEIIIVLLLQTYKEPNLNVQNGVLKAIHFLSEYMSHLFAPYIVNISELLCDALSERDAVHRQTALTIVKHTYAHYSTSLNVGDAKVDNRLFLLHLFNYIWPHMLEYSPHVINACALAIESSIPLLGGAFNQVLGGLFHPAKKVRLRTQRFTNLGLMTQPAAVSLHTPPMRTDSFHVDDSSVEYNLAEEFLIDI
ncbi:hypothetical protein PCE1_001571 [Barthelona sp. PCE]